MTLEQQVVSLDLAKRLKELGVKQESYFVWQPRFHVSEKFEQGRSLGKEWVWEEGYGLERNSFHDYRAAVVSWTDRFWGEVYQKQISAFTVAELGEMLPASIKVRDYPAVINTFKDGVSGNWYFWYSDEGGVALAAIDNVKTEADARAKMLIYLLENKILQS